MTLPLHELLYVWGKDILVLVWFDEPKLFGLMSSSYMVYSREGFHSLGYAINAY